MITISNDKAYRLLNHGPTVLVSTAHGNQRNIMAAAWNMPLDFDPPKIAIVIDKNTYSRELIGKTPDNKFASFDIPTFPSEKIAAPLVQGCVAWLECKVIPEPHIQNTYDLFLGEVVAAYADERVFSNGHWHFEEHDDLRTIHHVAGGGFLAIGEAFNIKA